VTAACPKCAIPLQGAPECPACGVVVERYRGYMAAIAAGAAHAVERPPGRPAGFWIRGAALGTDYAIVGAIELLADALAALLLGEARSGSRVYTAALRAFQILFGALYPVVFHWLWGQTFGKMLLGVRVVTVDGHPLSLRVALIRGVGYVLSYLTLGAGFVMAGLRPDKRALHDLVAGTRVERLD
jgi:uncharacterized RDD family membrane protein YckC